ncbi:hypothetical protein QQS21_011339 [Conoideocrella luteorostrata]|uniref:Non-haem dioxygenase N-terminal domain-containing protein n=1 Tax=Conoideocrella luteorostrata TaxID=1105319 RepID=A0AAJ0CDL4_9HYPO|nr:hypothetical protein QQS21_011339 [Conoideocrella luteorostrata]
MDAPSVPQISKDADLPTISVSQLMAGNAAAEAQLLDASTDLGFFYVDVRDHPGGLVDKITTVSSSALEFYNLPQGEKDA